MHMFFFSYCATASITIFISITLFCGTDNSLQNIAHIQIECAEYSTKSCQSHRTFVMNLYNAMSYEIVVLPLESIVD